MSTDTKADKGEAITIVEPLIPEEASKYRSPLNDLAVELASQSSGLRSSLPEGIRAPLADLVRSMNCYYSNLIEGHNTHPIDIERALNRDFSAVAEKRNLQLEAVAHIEVQRWIDTGGLTDHPLAPDSIREIHRRFCQNMPPELLVMRRPDGSELPIVPGEFRTGFVQVGKHVAPSPGAVPRLLAHMRKMYGLTFPKAVGYVSELVQERQLAGQTYKVWTACRHAKEHSRVGFQALHAVGDAGLICS